MAVSRSPHPRHEAALLAVIRRGGVRFCVALGCAVLGVLLATTAFAQAGASVEQLEQGLATAERTLDAAEVAFSDRRAAYLRELETVDRYKQLESATPFEVIELRGALQRANSAAEEVAEQDERVREAEARAQAARERLVVALRADIAAREAAFSSLAPSDVFGALSALNALQARVAELARPVATMPRVALEELIDDLPQTSEEMLAAADELDDRAASLERELESLRRQLSDALVDARLADRVSEFGLEESLFDDGTGRPSRVRTGGVSVAVNDRAEDDTADGPTVVAAPADTPNGEATSGGAPVDMGSSDDSAGFDAPESAGGGRDEGAGGGLDAAPLPMPTLGAEISDPTPPTGGAVRVDAPVVVARTADPTVIGAGSVAERQRRPGGSGVDALRSLEASLNAQLEAARRERDRLRRTAELLDE